MNRVKIYTILVMQISVFFLHVKDCESLIIDSFSAWQGKIAREFSVDSELLIYLECHISYKTINKCEFLELPHGSLKTYTLEMSKYKTFNNDNPLEVRLEGASWASDSWFLLVQHSII